MKTESNQTSKELQTFVQGARKAITHQIIQSGPQTMTFFATELFEGDEYQGLKTWLTEEQSITCAKDWLTN